MEKIIFNNIEFYKIKDFPDYAISKCGKVLSFKFKQTKTNKLLKNYINNKGYYQIALNNKKSKKIHRLLAEQFIPNPNNKLCVNHIDGNKLNNNLNNLEWVTYSENSLHAFKVLNQKSNMEGKFGILHHNSKKVNQYDLEGNYIKTWDSMSDVKRELNINPSGIARCCSNKRETAGQFKWRFTNDTL